MRTPPCLKLPTAASPGLGSSFPLGRFLAPLPPSEGHTVPAVCLGLVGSGESFTHYEEDSCIGIMFSLSLTPTLARSLALSLLLQTADG